MVCFCGFGVLVFGVCFVGFDSFLATLISVGWFMHFVMCFFHVPAWVVAVGTFCGLLYWLVSGLVLTSCFVGLIPVGFSGFWWVSFSCWVLGYLPFHLCG